MYAQRSGALPIAYRTGGLVDTIEDGLSGFLFSSLTGAGLTGAVSRALEAFRSKRAFRPVCLSIRRPVIADRPASPMFRRQARGRHARHGS